MIPRYCSLSPPIRALVLGLVYVISAWIGLALNLYPLDAPILWVPNGLLLAALVLSPRSDWLLLTVSAFVALILASLSVGGTLSLALACALIHTAATSVAAFAFTQRTTPPFALLSLQQALLFLLFTLALASTPAAFAGAAILSIGFDLPYSESWFIWWAASGLGMLLVGGTLLTWCGRPLTFSARPTWPRVIEAFAVVGLLLTIMLISFNTAAETPVRLRLYLTVPLVLWIAVRFGPRGVTLTILMVTLIAVWYTTHGRGPFVIPGVDPLLHLIGVQIFLLVQSASALALAALTTERFYAQQALAHAHDELEVRIAVRTAELTAANLRLTREIAERSQVESGLRESREQVRQALLLARMFTFEWDRTTDAVVRSITCAAILGLEGDDAIYDTGTNFFQRVHPDDRERMATLVQTCTPEKSSYQVLYRLIRPDGSVVTLEETAQAVFDSSGHNIRLFGLTADVTERQRAALRASRIQALTAALSAARTIEQVSAAVVEHGVAATEATAGTIVLRSAQEDLLTISAIVGYRAEAAVPWSKMPLHAEVPLAEAVRNGEAIWIESSAELLMRYPALQATPLRNDAFAVLPLSANDHTIGAIGLSFAQVRSFNEGERSYLHTLADLCAQALDRARLYTAEQEARSLAEAAVQLRDQFFSIASHELKGPLTVLLGHVRLLLHRINQQNTLGEREMRGLQAIVDQAERLNRLISILLDAARIDRGQLQLELAVLDLTALLCRLTDELQPALIQHHLALALPGEALIVRGDELRLEQLIQNLITNAIKYSPEGSKIEVNLQRSGKTALLMVHDHGIGISAEDLPQIFKRFFRARNAVHYQASGMGVGLYVAREIARLHGGSLTVQSEYGYGSTFSFSIPIHSSVSLAS